jgi:hypothetical protein
MGTRKVDLTEFELDLYKAAADNGMTAKKCGAVHFHLKGIFLLNIYPTTKSVYVQGANHKTTFTSIHDLLALAKGEKDLSGVTKGKRKDLGKGKRRQLWENGERNCFVCGEKFHFFHEATLEHKIPLSKGGSNRTDNLGLSHESCNHERGNKLSVSRKLEDKNGNATSDPVKMGFQRMVRSGTSETKGTDLPSVEVHESIRQAVPSVAGIDRPY